MSDAGERYHLFIVSDSTGDTAERATMAALSQFQGPRRIDITRFRNVKSELQIQDVLQKASLQKAFIIYTIVTGDLRKYLSDEAHRLQVSAVDLIGPLLQQMENYLQKHPSSEPGLIHRVDRQYFQRMDAIQFAVKHDDGQSLHTIYQADIILLGLSRSGKTPLSMYLAQFGWKVANIPLILNLAPPSQLFRVDQEKVIGLQTLFEILMKVRKARAKALQQKATMNYAMPDYIVRELKYCEDLYRQNPRWKCVEVGDRAVEEISADILSLMGLNKTRA
ncbi:MAG TPA: pyruvate, water dikinase regulatory protein [Nitrospiria bacterium]|nr:pyruvate, water dikinase regulatory protein [Nitrospiria bacterium]